MPYLSYYLHIYSDVSEDIIDGIQYKYADNSLDMAITDIEYEISRQEQRIQEYNQERVEINKSLQNLRQEQRNETNMQVRRR